MAWLSSNADYDGSPASANLFRCQTALHGYALLTYVSIVTTKDSYSIRLDINAVVEQESAIGHWPYDAAVVNLPTRPRMSSLKIRFQFPFYVYIFFVLSHNVLTMMGSLSKLSSRLLYVSSPVYWGVSNRATVRGIAKVVTWNLRGAPKSASGWE